MLSDVKPSETMAPSGISFPNAKCKNQGHCGTSFSGCKCKMSASFFHGSVGKCKAKNSSLSRGIVLIQFLMCLITAPLNDPAYKKQDVGDIH